MISQLNFAQSNDAHHFLFRNTGVTSSSSERYRWFQWATEDELFSEDELMKGNAKMIGTLNCCPISGETTFFFGFDPVGAHYNVLAVSDAVDAHILTLVEGGELVWTPAPTNLPYSLDYQIRSGGEVHMVVLDDYQTQKWSKHSFILLGWGSLVLDNLDDQYHCMGTVFTGEPILAPESYVRSSWWFGCFALLQYGR
ncbi:hypothetical protein OROGR_012765 [Orobanche gracilis]